MTDASKTLLSPAKLPALAIGAIALAVCGIGALFMPAHFLRAYLVAYLFWLGIAHGCLVVLMIYYLTGGAWGFVLRRILEAAIGTLPLLAILFIPIGLGAAELYDWARPAEVAASAELTHKSAYLNVAAFWVRAAAYFAIWIAIALMQRRWSRREDAGDVAANQRLIWLAGPALVAFAITITFAAVDWLMSLQPAFRSTIFGPLLASGEVLTGFAAALMFFACLVQRPPLREAASVEAIGDLGSLLFTFVCVWSYLTFFQFMLIWMANLRYDVIWYLPRLRGGWQYVVGVMIVLHFIVPFFLLLMRDIKRNPTLLSAVAALLLVMHLTYLNYQVLPAFPDVPWYRHWFALVAPVGIGGLWLANFVWNLELAPLLGLHDPNAPTAEHDRAADHIAAVREAHHG